MKRFRLATTATLLGVVLSAGCAGPCGGCGYGFTRMSMFRARRACCPCECCSSCGGGGVPIVGAGPDFGDGPLLEPPGPELGAMPGLGAMPPSAGLALPPSAGLAVPETLPGFGAPPLGVPSVPGDAGRINPFPNGAQPLPAGPSSRVRSR